MRAVLVLVALLSACSKKSEPSPNQEPTPAPAPAPAKPAEPAPAPAPPPAAAPTFDCAAIVTAADFKQVCNAAVEVAPTMFEGKGTLTTCSRSVKQPGTSSASQWALATFSDAAQIEAYFSADTLTRRTPIAGVGDAAWAADRELSATHTKDHDVVVRKGNVLVIIGNTQTTSGPRPPCSNDKLVEIAKLAVARLP